MRRWVCIVALLAGFAGDDYARAGRLRQPVPIERLIDRVTSDRRVLAQTGSWWARPSR